MKVPPGGGPESFYSARRRAGKAAMKLVEHVEGKTRLIVPAASLESVPPPTSPVFFNPAASVNRDVSVAITASTGGASFCDSMAGLGARGLRVAREVGGVGRVAFVDFNRGALGIARRAAALNGTSRKCEFSVSETSSYLFSRHGEDARFNCVDVDPFGSPIGQLQGALAATSDGGVTSVTATDTAVLCGVYPKVARRRYGATPLNNAFNHETAIRLLAGAAVRVGASQDLGVRPVAAHSTKHYLRLFLRVERGATKADESLSNMGHVTWCPQCGHVTASPDGEKVCGRCGRPARAAGPVWTGGIADQKLIVKAEKAAAGAGLTRAAELLAGLRGVDAFPPWSFSIERACSLLGVATVPESYVHRNLEDLGYRAMRTPFEKTGVKTEASFDEVVKAVKASASASRGGIGSRRHGGEGGAGPAIFPSGLRRGSRARS